MLKFSDIPQFIDRSQCYHVNYGIVGYLQWIRNEQNEYGLEMNPEFQRGHVWTIEQQIKYVEFILSGGQTGRDFYFNKKHLYSNQNAINEYVCVDGLQRTTALQKFINNEIKVFNQYYNDFDRRLNKIEYTVSIYINELKTDKEIFTWYIQFNDGGTIHSKKEIKRVKDLLSKL